MIFHTEGARRRHFALDNISHEVNYYSINYYYVLTFVGAKVFNRRGPLPLRHWLQRSKVQSNWRIEYEFSGTRRNSHRPTTSLARRGLCLALLIYKRTLSRFPQVRVACMPIDFLPVDFRRRTAGGDNHPPARFSYFSQ